MSVSPILRLRDAAFGYDGRAVVSGVSLEVNPGEIIAVLGPNGSGKSTLMRGILGLNDHVSGQVELFGTPASSFKARTRIGYVPQRHTLSASVRATVEEVVEVGRLPHRPWYRRADAVDRRLVTAALAEVGLADRSRDDVATLSGGQHRRVLIARALAAQPDILVMDEPTAGVDTASQEVLAEVLERLAASGVTMIIVTHEIEALHGIVTRIVEVAHGAVTFDGPPARYGERVSASLGGASLGGHDHHAEDLPHHAPGYARGPFDDARFAPDHGRFREGDRRG
ncbi:metal ABC transporter ATP-binding protein [Dermacoccus nishinomiyaensis]|uniref:metal ABC transporter ATP-binding protein n=1 Tax=Dermacoccus TaxID=57495 RepID=UPI0001E63C36|nr:MULTISPECIES: metal ABC transporter ATP-binding protein [Dermacoccus]EFP58858.1 ABC transporter, ATP-binding protein [Dermacoccus sp. Ellin185]TCJ91976.1 zinc transport system ATP-binding protein [Dermacoccus sp. SAI-028]TJZ98512.1 metal ABC transporter ATP-binding protein [Dermacoccus nishinomiyaensis]